MGKSEPFFLGRMTSPIGPAVVIADSQGALRMHFWEDADGTWRQVLQRRLGEVELVEQRDPFGHIAALQRYFDGDIGVLDTLPVVFSGTPFQQTVWQGLRSIAAGTTLSYGALAQRIGAPKAVRAVGLANGQNPIGVVVPCHRVIGSNGSLTGYGGGLPRKRWLLQHEARHSTFRLEMHS